MANICQSASLQSIALYLKHANNYDEATALNEAKEVMRNLVIMRQKGFISGWYFDERGYLELLPNDVVIEKVKKNN